jgi:hypothetical protein
VAFYRLQRMWTSLLVIGIPLAVLAVVWAIFMGGRATTGVLAGCYLLIAAAGRAHSAEQARRQKPVRLARVRTQVDRVKASLVVDDAEDAEPAPEAAIA